MKKEFLLRFEGTYFILENKSNPQKRFSIDIENLQFDTKAFYDALFSNVKTHIEIIISRDNSLDQISDPNAQKIAKHVCETIESITKQVCDRLNNECFKAPELSAT